MIVPTKLWNNCFFVCLPAEDTQLDYDEIGHLIAAKRYNTITDNLQLTFNDDSGLKLTSINDPKHKIKIQHIAHGTRSYQDGVGANHFFETNVYNYINVEKYLSICADAAENINYGSPLGLSYLKTEVNEDKTNIHTFSLLILS